MFLDPEGKKSIPLGQAISLLKFAGLAPGVSKKIFDNLKLTGINIKLCFRQIHIGLYRNEKSTQGCCVSSKQYLTFKNKYRS